MKKIICLILSAGTIFLLSQYPRSLPAQHINKPCKPFENYNIVLVFIDTLRADHLNCYGYQRKTSPNIDRLARESIVFERNFTPVTYTLPSFMSIITSVYPNSHSVLDICKDKLSSRVITLAQILRSYSYKTAWFGPLVDLQLKPDVGFGRGFDELEDIPGGNKELAGVRKRLCGWLDANKDRRFFLNFHTYTVHAPYLPSPEYKARFTKIKNPGRVIEDISEFKYGFVDLVMKNKRFGVDLMGEDLFNQFAAAKLSSSDVPQVEDFFISTKKREKLSAIRDRAYWAGMDLKDKEVNAYVQTLYDADILEYDEEIVGPLIEKLKALSLYDKTIIIICSDHGEEFFEHGSSGHGITLYDEVTSVPLVIRVPWIKEALRVKEFAQTVDILPTLLDLLEIPVPRQAQGKSFADFINKKNSLPLHEYVFGRMLNMHSVRSQEWLFVSHDDPPYQKELYDLRSDPKQQNNVYFANKDTALKLESRIQEWEGHLPSYKDQEYSFSPEIDKATQERIRKTGYW